MGAFNSRQLSNNSKIYPPQSTLLPFPKNLVAAPGDLLIYFNAKPPNYNLPSKVEAGLYWWADIDFVPFQDNQLYVSVGAYINRPNSSPLKASHLLQGLIYKWIFKEGRHKIELLKGSRTTALPNIMVHPSGESILYVGMTTVHLMNISSMKSLNREKSMRNNSFQHASISPNGYFIATMARCAPKIELGLLYIDPFGYLTDRHYINCDQLCPGFTSNRTYTDRHQCRFSPDSKCIAAATSYGHLLIVFREQLELQCSVSPGLVQWGVDNMSNERSFDFDPRYAHEKIAFGSISNNVHFCDTENNIIETTIKLGDNDKIQCLKYAQRGNCLAVACSSGLIYILEPDYGECIMKLDAAFLPTEAALNMVNGFLAEALHMSFTTIGDVLAVSYTDGYVRLWKLQPVINLQELCKLAIMRYVRINEICKLPIPGKLMQEMSDIYQNI